MTDVPDPTPTRGPTQVSDRSLAPDLARGFMLLLMALAHSYVFLYSVGVAYSPADQATVLIEQTAISERARPMFFLLFGYGLGQLLRRQTARGNDWASTRALLRRRGWAMVLIGTLHAALLFYDVIAAYGLATVALVGVLRTSDRKLLRISAVFMVVTFVLYFLIGTASPPLASSMAPAAPVFALPTRLIGWGVSLALIGFVLVPALLIGIWAARRSILDEPQHHRAFLTRTAAIGISLAVVGGPPKAMIDSLLWTEPSALVSGFAAALHGATGMAGGIGAIALVALAAITLETGHGAVVTALQALGQRSLTFYLFQSLVFVAVFAPFAGGLGAHTGFAGAAAVALATWLASLVLADVMRRLGHRGPAEVLLRRLTYGRRE